MFFIPGVLLSAITFPGVIVHEMAHQFFCRLFKLTIFEVCYFRFGNPSGYVVHELSKKPIQNIIVGIGPFILNTVVGAVIALPAVIPLMTLKSGSAVDYFLMWLGISIVAHAFPSTGDASSIWESVKSKEVPMLVKIIAAPIVGLIKLGAIGSIFWLDYVYAFAVVMILPNVIVQMII